MISIRLAQLCWNTSKVLAVCICISFASLTHAQNIGDDDTILVEKSPDLFNCYRSALRAFSKELLGAYIGDFFASSVQYRNDVIRNFNELASRTNYRVNLNQDRVELKLTLDF